MSEGKLDTREARTDLTSRECSKILGGLLGGLMHMTTPEELRTAVRWWAEKEEAWDMLKATQTIVRNQLFK